MHERTRENKIVTNDQQLPANMTDVILSASEVREVIARRAYDLYKLRSPESGDEMSDWLRAEAEVVTMLLADPQEAADMEKGIVQPLARRRNTRGVRRAGNVTQPASRLQKRKSVLKNNPA